MHVSLDLSDKKVECRRWKIRTKRVHNTKERISGKLKEVEGVKRNELENEYTFKLYIRWWNSCR